MSHLKYIKITTTIAVGYVDEFKPWVSETVTKTTTLNHLSDAELLELAHRQLEILSQ